MNSRSSARSLVRVSKLEALELQADPPTRAALGARRMGVAGVRVLKNGRKRGTATRKTEQEPVEAKRANDSLYFNEEKKFLMHF